MHKIETIKSIVLQSIDTSEKVQKSFFKTGVGDYSEHDQFIGVRVPTLRKIAKDFSDLSFEGIQGLLESSINEERLLALIILVGQYQKKNALNKQDIYDFYVRHLKHVNNWNLVDASAHLIIGAHLFARERGFLDQLAVSEVMWERRISIVSTWYFIRNNDLDSTFQLAKVLLNDKHDLIHKAVGWMLREAGEKDESQLIAFLNQHVLQMPRTMLRYSIEKFDEKTRKMYLAI